mgnify:CR=1 FL=1
MQGRHHIPIFCTKKKTDAIHSRHQDYRKVREMARGRKRGSLLTFIQKEKKKPQTSYKVDTTQCKKCLYRPPKYGTHDIPFGCYYIFLMGHRRPSEPSPNCTAFKLYSRRERAKLIYDLRQKFVRGDMGVQ